MVHKLYQYWGGNRIANDTNVSTLPVLVEASGSLTKFWDLLKLIKNILNRLFKIVLQTYHFSGSRLKFEHCICLNKKPPGSITLQLNTQQKRRLWELKPQIHTPLSCKFDRAVWNFILFPRGHLQVGCPSMNLFLWASRFYTRRGIDQISTPLPALINLWGSSS